MSSGAAPVEPTRDLDTVDDVAEMVRRFYQDVAQDDLLGPIFIDVAQVDWNEHLPKLTAFWSRILLGIHGYSGNPLRSHFEIHAREPFTHAHFERWFTLFEDTVHGGWRGPVADRALHMARNVARVHSTQLTGEPYHAPLADEGGDRPCWEGVVVDHRDHPAPAL